MDAVAAVFSGASPAAEFSHLTEDQEAQLRGYINLFESVCLNRCVGRCKVCDAAPKRQENRRLIRGDRGNMS